MDLNKQIGVNIKKIRITKNMTQEELASKLQLKGCNLSRSTVAKIEIGLRILLASELKYFRDVLEADYEDFFK